jgi:ribonuclease D
MKPLSINCLKMFIESIDSDRLKQLEYASFPGKIQVIDGVGADFNRAVAYLRSQKVIGFDTETRPCFSANQPRYGVALLQLSGPEKAFLFRVNKMGMHRRLCSILADEKIVKVGAAIHDDIRGLQKLNDFKAGGFVDLQRIVWEWGIRDKSVKKMAAIIMGFRISKTQQLSNWEAETLSEQQCKYAATDAWVCREMYLKLMKTDKHPLELEEK